MPRWERELRTEYLFRDAKPYFLDRRLLERWLGSTGVLARPTVEVVDFHPSDAYAGVALAIVGNRFSEDRAANLVKVGNRPAFVVEATTTRLLVLTDPTCETGPVEVTVDGHLATAPRDFHVRPWPAPGTGAEAPPYSYEGRGLPGDGGGWAAGGSPGTASAGDLPATGTARVLVVLTYPTDMVPASEAQVRNDAVATFGNVRTFYDQASYGALDVQVDVTQCVALLEDSAYYHRANGAAGYPNLDADVLHQLAAEAAQGAVDQSYDLDDYAVMVVLVHLPGLGVRAWGGGSMQQFTYNDGVGTSINLVADHALSMVWARHDADWGRAAHEIGHCLVDGGLVLGEDVYASDLVDPSQATAASFEMMGSHDSHPLFSGWYMQQLGYYAAPRILELPWDRNAFSAEYDVVAHGDALDTDPSRYHLIRIKVSPGLDYYVEVRQRPPAGAAQIYDTGLPVPAGATRRGGVVVTKAISGLVNNNQQTRLITLLHGPEVLLTDHVATDPLRDLRVRVIDDEVSTNPLVCRVRVEWAQHIADTPGGDFDLWLTPWNANYETVDIWVDRQPFGTYDFTDPSGNPTGNGDEPRPMEVNRFWARVHDTGVEAHDVRLTFYAISPPGVGDNGTWTPIETKELAAVPADDEADAFVNWIPTLGEHTCLKVVAEPQLGEVAAGGNNGAQENVFHFQPAAHSVPEPVSMPVAVRNPSDRDAVVYLEVSGVPEGYRVYLPHRWVALPGRGEARMDLLVVPTLDYGRLREMIEATRRKLQGRGDPAPRVRVRGRLTRGYAEKVGTDVPGSWFSHLGGVTTRVEPKLLSTIRLEEDRERSKEDLVVLRGTVTPPMAGQKLRVALQADGGFAAYDIVKTGAQGTFLTRFVLPPIGAGTTAPPEGTRPVGTAAARAERLAAHIERLRVRERRRAVVYRAQAEIFNAAALAPAQSNVVHVTRGAR